MTTRFLPKLGEDTTSPYSITWIPYEDPCDCGITAVATDIFGQIATSDPVYVTVVPPEGDEPPVARINNLSNAVVQVPARLTEAAVGRDARDRQGAIELKAEDREP